LAKLWPSLFGYQILLECVRPEPAVDIARQALARMNSIRDRGQDERPRS